MVPVTVTTIDMLTPGISSNHWAKVSAEAMLPVSGLGSEINMIYVIAAVGLILLLIVGGIAATRHRGYRA